MQAFFDRKIGENCIAAAFQNYGISGYQHILEPSGQTKRFLPDASIPALLTAPGLAFDRSGARIGYGKGFYDRYLGKIPAADRPYLVGLCFSCQLFKTLDGQKPHDINMDLIVTERR